MRLKTAILAALAIAAFAYAPATADAAHGQLRNARYPLKCLDAHPGQNYNRGQVYLWDCVRYMHWPQRWFEFPGRYGSVHLVAQQDQRCLDANPAAQNPGGFGGRVYRWDCQQGNPFQEWYRTRWGGYESRSHPGRCLNVSGNAGGNPTYVTLYFCNSGWRTQRWFWQ